MEFRKVWQCECGRKYGFWGNGEKEEIRERFWFIAYMYSIEDRSADVINTVINVHPIEWINKINANKSGLESYRLVFYRETSKEQFEKVHGKCTP